MINKQDMAQDVESILFTEEQIAERVKEVGKVLTRDYQGKNLILLGILRGAVPFYAAMAQRIALPVVEDFMTVSSYGNGTTSSGHLLIKQDMQEDVKGRDVLILEDILDTGNTLKMVKELLYERGANSVKICALLDKKEGRKVRIEADYYCFRVPNAFLVGYGLDYAGYYRNLPFVGILRPSVYKY